MTAGELVIAVLSLVVLAALVWLVWSDKNVVRALTERDRAYDRADAEAARAEDAEAALAGRDDWLASRIRREVLVHTIDDQSIRGILFETAPDGVLLAAATFLGTERRDLAGDVYVPRSNIRFVQVVTERQGA